MTVTVIGLGNRMRRDDGAGPTVVAVLRPLVPPDVEIRELDGVDPGELLGAWRGARLAVVDATRLGGSPGAVRHLETACAFASGTPAASSSHGSGLADGIEVGRALGQLPDQLIVIVIEGADFGHGEG
jgi:hydrogenase maturation protease